MSRPTFPGAAVLWAAVLLPLSSGASVRWRGDFETGDRSQWSWAQWVSPDRLQVVEAPVREGRHALRVLVRQGDDPIQASGNRNELVHMTRETVGSEYYYRWSTLFASDFPSANTWQIFTQWHHDGCCGSPPIEFYALGEQMRLKVGGSAGRILWMAPLVRGVWHDFIFHVKWSPDASEGFVELFHNAELALPKTMAATMFPGMLNYLKQGLYRNSTVTSDGVLFHDGMMQATALSDVWQERDRWAGESRSGSTAGDALADAGVRPVVEDAAPEPSRVVGPDSEGPAPGEESSGPSGRGCVAGGIQHPLGVLVLVLGALRRRRSSA